MLSREIRHAVAHLYEQIRTDSLSIGSVVRACEIFADVADRVEVIEDLIVPPALTAPEIRPGVLDDLPEDGKVARLDHWRQRARPHGGASPSPQAPA